MAASEGVHNGVQFTPDEIEATVGRATVVDNDEGKMDSYLRMPIILDYYVRAHRPDNILLEQV